MGKIAVTVHATPLARKFGVWGYARVYNLDPVNSATIDTISLVVSPSITAAITCPTLVIAPNSFLDCK